MAQDNDDISNKGAGRAKRTASFFARRGGLNKAFDTTRQGADFISDLADAARPRRIDKSGYQGRYPDGGVQRFNDMIAGMSQYQLDAQLSGWKSQRKIFYFAALFSLLAVPLGLIFLGISKFLVLGLIFMFLFAMFRSVRADYYAWIMEQARFGGFRDYLTTRLPRNMQIISSNNHNEEDR